MTNLQSLRRLTDPDTARRILDMIEGELDPCEVSPAADQWSRSCYTFPPREEEVMYAVNELLGGYGIEGWADESDPRSGVSYVNTGDTYALTLALVRGRFMVTSYEQLATRYGPC